MFGRLLEIGIFWVFVKKKIRKKIKEEIKKKKIFYIFFCFMLMKYFLLVLYVLKNVFVDILYVRRLLSVIFFKIKIKNIF